MRFKAKSMVHGAGSTGSGLSLNYPPKHLNEVIKDDLTKPLNQKGPLYRRPFFIKDDNSYPLQSFFNWWSSSLLLTSTTVPSASVTLRGKTSLGRAC